jgi:hypothetical protein
VNLFRDIWFNTEKTIDHCRSQPENIQVYYQLLPSLFAFAEFFEYVRRFGWELFPLFLIALPAVTIVLFKYLYPWIVLRVGRLMSGAARLDEIRLIFYLCSIPSAILVLFYTLEILVPGDQTARAALFEIIVWIFTVRILVIGISRVQKISYTFAVMNLAIPHIIFVAIYLIIRY